jgi:hypothetical protein
MSRESHCSNRRLRCAMRMRLASEITHAHHRCGITNTRTASSVIYKYKYSWYYPPLHVDACHPTYNSHLRHLSSVAAPQPARSASWKAVGRRSARTADKPDERQTNGADSNHPAARSSLWRWVWVLPGRLLPSRRTCRNWRRTRVDPCRPRDRVAGARAHRGPLSLSFERPSWSRRNRAGENCADARSSPLRRLALVLRHWSSCYRLSPFPAPLFLP